VKNNKVNNAAIGKHTIIGIGISVILSIVFSALIAGTILSGRLKEESAGIMILTASFVSVAAGAIYAGKMVKKGYLVVCGISAVGYIFLQLITSVLFFDARLMGVGRGICACMLGWLVACAVCMIGGKKNRRRK
jgi:putative membrane protein (TIGR04086 family)